MRIFQVNNSILKTLIAVFILLNLSSCHVGPRLPKGFPEKKEFAQILADVHFSDAIVSQVRTNALEREDVANGYYHDILLKYNLTQEKFDTIVAWYTSYPEIYQEVYEESINILNEKEAGWQRIAKEENEEKERIKKIKEARNLWPKEQRIINIPTPDSIDKQIPFEFLVDTINNRGFKVSAYYQFLHGNKVDGVEMLFISLNSDSTLDTLKYRIPATFSNKKSEVIVSKKDSLDIIKISGYLFKHDTSEVGRARIRTIEFEYIPKEDSLLLE